MVVILGQFVFFMEEMVSEYLMMEVEVEVEVVIGPFFCLVEEMGWEYLILQVEVEVVVAG